MGIAALEAMSAGLPLVASNIRGVTEYAVDQKNSLLFAPDDVDGFASAIQRLHEDEPLRKQLGMLLTIPLKNLMCAILYL